MIRGIDRNQNWPELAHQTSFNAVELAQQLNISRWTLHRHMKSLFGQSPQKWLNEQRLLLAAKMLEECVSLKSLAYTLGYKTQSHFCHQFKRHYGSSPTQFLLKNVLCCGTARTSLQSTFRARSQQFSEL